jgi:alkylation response protein AidB-like acyl-CoA dehydrogenase
VKIDLHLDDDDLALADAAERYARDRLAARTREPLERRRFNEGAWREMARLGWLAVNTEEAHGGLGVRAGSMALLARQAGAAGLAEPLASTAFVGAEVLRHHTGAEQRDRWLPLLLEGRLRVACAFASLAASGDLHFDNGRLHGVREAVPDADLADLLLVQLPHQDSLRWVAVVPADGVTRTPCPLLDGRAAATLRFETAAATLLPGVDNGAAERVAGFVAAADALGAMEAAFALTLEHVKTRRQFGAPLASHQVVVHRAVEMSMRVQESRAVLARAVRALQADPAGRAGEVHAAKAFIAPQAKLVAQDAVQLHGGIGITEEYGVSHCLRRILVDEHWGGGPRRHLDAFMQHPVRR